MSHFTVAVISRKQLDEDTLASIMAPYDENLIVAPYIGETAADYLKKKREEFQEYKDEGCYAEYIKDPESYIKEFGERNPGHIEYLKNFMNLYNSTDEELLEKRRAEYKKQNDDDWEYGESFLDEHDNRIDYYNPNSKWDWYSVGGRWEGLLTKKDGYACNIAQIKDVEWGNNPDYEKYKSDEDFVKGYNNLLEVGDTFRRASYFKEIYPTIEDYIRSKVAITTFAVIDANGFWHEKGQMGWFACSSETPEEARDWNRSWYDVHIKDVNPEWYVTIVDCHI